MDGDITALNERVREEAAPLARLRDAIGQVIIGQQYLVDRLIVGLLANGHVLLEGVPGLAKTLSVKTLAQSSRGHVYHQEGAGFCQYRSGG